MVKDFSAWLDTSRSQSLRSLQLGFDLLDLAIGVVRDSEVVYPVPCSLWSDIGFSIPFRLPLCAGFPRPDECQIVSCARTDQSLTIDIVALRYKWPSKSPAVVVVVLALTDASTVET